jgi:hypothetical protein
MKNIANIQIKDDKVFYDFSSFEFIKRLKMAYFIVRYGMFTVRGKTIITPRQLKIRESEEI